MGAITKSQNKTLIDKVTGQVLLGITARLYVSLHTYKQINSQAMSALLKAFNIL